MPGGGSRNRGQRPHGLKVAIFGDLLHSRVLRSNILLLTKLGAEVWVCGPATLIPPGLDRYGVRVTTSVDAAVENADVIMIIVRPAAKSERRIASTT